MDKKEAKEILVSVLRDNDDFVLGSLVNAWASTARSVKSNKDNAQIRTLSPLTTKLIKQ